jgi:hypothetical protein
MRTHFHEYFPNNFVGLVPDTQVIHEVCCLNLFFYSELYICLTLFILVRHTS